MNPAEIINAVAEETEISAADIRGPSRLRQIILARHMTVSLGRKFGVSQSRLAIALSRDHATIHYIEKRAPHWAATVSGWQQSHDRVEQNLIQRSVPVFKSRRGIAGFKGARGNA